MKWLWPFCFYLLLPLAGLGQSPVEIPEHLELKRALEIAVANNPELQAAHNEIDVASAQRLEASKRPNPAFSLNFEDYRLFSVEPGPFFQTQEITARLDQELETRGKRRLRTEAANLALQVQKARYDNALRQLGLEVRRAYFQGVLAQSNLAVSETILGEIDRVIGLNRTRLEKGDISGVELRRVEVERLRFMDDVFAARLALANAKLTLLTLLGVPLASPSFSFSEALGAGPDGLAPGEGTPRLLPLAELEREALAQRPDLLASSLEERRADTETALQRAIRSPNVTVGAGYKRNLDENSMVFGVTVPLRVFNRNEGGIARARAEKDRAEKLSAQTRNQVLLELRKAYNAVEINRERVAYIEAEALKKASEAHQIVLAAYRLGGSDLINLLDTQRARRETQKVYYQALYDYRLSLYELASAAGLEEAP